MLVASGAERSRRRALDEARRALLDGALGFADLLFRERAGARRAALRARPAAG